MNDNCVSYRTLKLQIPESPMRPHFVKARVKVHVYPDGSHALFHGPRCIGRYEENGTIRKCEKRRLNPLGGETLWTAWTSLWLAHPAHRRTKAEEADIRCAAKTGQLNSLSTSPAPEKATSPVKTEPSAFRLPINPDHRRW
jgi:hypothetical protein